MIFVAINILLLFLGCILESVSIIFITLPILFPLIMQLGFDPIWFNVVMLLNLELLKFASSCTETIKEFASYIWDEKALERGEDKPVKQHDHSCDAVRYFVSTVLGSKVARLREISR